MWRHDQEGTGSGRWLVKDGKTRLKAHTFVIAIAVWMLGGCASLLAPTFTEKDAELTFRPMTQTMHLSIVTQRFHDQYARWPEELGELRGFSESSYPDEAAMLPWDRLTDVTFLPKNNNGLRIKFTYVHGEGESVKYVAGTLDISFPGEPSLHQGEAR